MRRIEDPRFLRGEGAYTDDLPSNGEAYVAFVRSPHAHARILRIDVEPARHAPGVLEVLTAADYLADGCRGIAHTPVPADAIDVARPAFAGLEVRQLPLANERVRFVGEAVAMLIAETAELARDASELVEVEYAVFPSVFGAVGALPESAPTLHDEVPGNVAVDARFGDAEAVDRALAAAHTVVSLEARSQRIVNCQLEPRSVRASYDQESETYTIVAGSQGAVRQRVVLAGALGVATERVHVVCPDVGGGFGPRTNVYPEQIALAWAARRLGRGLRWTSSRTEAFLTDLQGRDLHVSASLALTSDGRILALSADARLNAGAYTVSYVPLSNALRILSSVYRILSSSIRVRAVLSNTVPTGPYRGAGRPEAIFLIERLLDLAACTLGMDRIELRRRNLIDRRELPYTTATGLTYDSGDFLGNVRRALDLSDWTGFPVRRARALERGMLAGIGLANYVEAPVGAPHERVRLTVLPDDTVELVAGTQSTGQGHATTFAQVAADALGIDPRQVRLITGDTTLIPSGGGTHSDRSMRLAGTLIVEAAEQIRRQAVDLAAELLGAQPATLQFNDGVVSNGEARLSIFELSGRGPLTADATFSGRIPAYPTGCAVAEVEIDPETGKLELVRYTCVDDVGQPINPTIVHGQTHGGIAQGVGQVLFEGVSYDHAGGQPVAASFLDYALPRSVDLPELRTELVEDPTTGNPLRVKGGGESGITPCMAAVVNAAVDALAPYGVKHLEMPLTPARIWGITRGALP